MRDALSIADQILAHFDAERGDAIDFAMAVHRRVEELARIGQLVPDQNALSFQRRNRLSRGALILPKLQRMRPASIDLGSVLVAGASLRPACAAPIFGVTCL